jgi:hypothetical protein
MVKMLDNLIVLPLEVQQLSEKSRWIRIFISHDTSRAIARSFYRVENASLPSNPRQIISDENTRKYIEKALDFGMNLIV